MRKLLCIMLILCSSLSVMFGEPVAVLSRIQGKVEIKPARGTWTPAVEGMKVNLMDTISTGFNSTAALKLEDNIVQVSPLTRLTLDKLLEQSGNLSTNLYLKVGKVTADVKSSKGLSQSFSVQSQYSTASVRGTKLVYDGIELSVIEGTVRLVLGQPKRDLSQYFSNQLKDKLKEMTDSGTEIDLEGLPPEEVRAILEEIIDELVESGDIDRETAEAAVNLILGLEGGNSGGSSDGSGGNDGVDVKGGNSVTINPDGSVGNGAGSGGGSGSGTEDNGPRKTKGSIQIEWEGIP